jgi:hypothetical protein
MPSGRRAGSATAADPDGLTHEQRLGIDAWLDGATQIEAAKAAGVERRAIWSWLREAKVAAYVKKVRKAQSDSAYKNLFDIQERRWQRLVDLWDGYRERQQFYEAQREASCPKPADEDGALEPMALAASKGTYAPGAASGFLSSEKRMIGGGESAIETTVWQWETGILREILTLEKEILAEERRCGRDLHDAKLRLAEIAGIQARTKLTQATLESELIRQKGGGVPAAWATGEIRDEPAARDEDERAALDAALLEIDGNIAPRDSLGNIAPSDSLGKPTP